MFIDPTLTAERLREILAYDPLTGVFIYRIRCGARALAGAVAGSSTRGYWQIRIAGVLYYAHRLVWLHVHGVWPRADIDHINGDKLDNRLANLREATRLQNCQNTLRTFGPTVSGLRGVSWDKSRRKWQSALTVNGRHFFLGYFDTPEEGYSAYLKAKRLHHPFWVDA